jgi:uncharacterized SAM-binding protein YcdF (DUF218 family)
MLEMIWRGIALKVLNIDKKAAKRRLMITIIIAVLAVVLSGISFALMLSRLPNMHVVFCLVTGLSVLVIVYLVLWTLSADEKRAKLATKLMRYYRICLAVGLALFLTLQGLILSGSHTDAAEADCIIILGAGLRNGAPSLILQRRLNAAIGYLHEHGDVPVVVTGGLDRNETITEAESMFRYLVNHGVDESLIIKEEKSTSTRENLAFAVALMEEHGLSAERIKVAVVTNEFHLYRAKLIAKKLGLDAVGISAETPYLNVRALYSFREAFALLREFLF